MTFLLIVFYLPTPKILQEFSATFLSLFLRQKKVKVRIKKRKLHQQTNTKFC